MKDKRKPHLPIAELPNAFQQRVAEALERIHDPAWLGDHSPFSAPYFLGDRLRDRLRDRSEPRWADEAIHRGEILQQLLRQSANTLADQGKDGQENSRLIKLTYLQSIAPDEVAEQLGVSRATYYRRHKQALRQLSDTFLRQVRPALRLEQPACPPQLIGREQIQADCLRALQQGQTVGLSGPAGVGKTTLGADLIKRWHPHPVFWFTFVPGLNDRLGNLLFALGWFLWQQGVPSLWGQLMADQGRINPAVLLGVLRLDLENLRDSLPLLCFDEVDLLRPDEVEAHAQVLTFLETLHSLCPCLLIGQRPLIEVDEQHALSGLDPRSIVQRLAAAGIQISIDDLNQLVAHTNGNPRLLDLFVALHRAGEPIGDVLSRLNTSPSIEFLLNRIWQHLDEAEQQLLYDLTPFRKPAPADAWDQSLCTRLADRHMIVRNLQGGIALLPAFRTVLFGQLPADARRSVHLRAASIRATRAEYTAAVYHCLQAGEPHMAIWLWQLHSSAEINQGQGDAALALFEQVDSRSLAAADRDALALIRGELHKLVGHDPRTELRQTLWQSPVFKSLAKRLEGDLAELKGQIDEARMAYQAGLETIENLLAERVLFEKNLAWTYMRQGSAGLETAWQKASLARFEAERLQGDIKWRLNDFAQAEIYYTEALALAESLGYLDGQAKTHNHLATLYARQGKLDIAALHRGKAIALFEQIGNQVHLAGAKLNMAFDHNLIGQQRAVMPPADPAVRFIFEQAATAAQEALRLFEQLRQAFGQTIAAQNLAEAYLYLGDLASAENYVHRVIAAQVRDVLPDGLRTLGEVRLERQDYFGAETHIRQAIQSAQENKDRYLEAYGQRALVRLYLTQHQVQEARAAFEQAMTLFEGLDLPQEIERTHITWRRYQGKEIFATADN